MMLYETECYNCLNNKICPNTYSSMFCTNEKLNNENLKEFGYAPGDCQNKCSLCDKLFIGDKIASTCLECATIGVELKNKLKGGN